MYQKNMDIKFPGRRYFEFLCRNMVAPLLYTKER